MPKGRRTPSQVQDSPNLGNPGDEQFSQPNTPPKRRKKSQGQYNTNAKDLIPPVPMGPTPGPLVAQNPFDDQPHAPLPHRLTLGQRHMQTRMPVPGSLPPMSGPLMAGKVYPPNASMIFNPSNPNAPPIYPCGVCHKEVHDNDQAILCESGCNFWFHRACTGLTEPAFLMLTQEVYAEWVCNQCSSHKNIPLVKMKS
ncbi:hypothetical protein CHS0354_014314 [Potamilus streckersoni]|uniref:PHD-type domain-containing protein n=1 Tax=Potamilus streckersoni TaxID=2493646 RepID=A0AAE0VYL8_9BIVA|nr:hypothetical protein CHS0354_014314 [Potamilus streckersoni]